MLAVALGRSRTDARRLTRRIASSDPKALASLDVDSFGELDELAGGVYRMRSDLTRALAGAERQNALLQQIMNGLGEGAVAIDRLRRIVLANRRFAELFALQGDLVGRPIGEVVRNSALFSAFDRALDYSASTDHFQAAGRKIEIRAFPQASRPIAVSAPRSTGCVSSRGESRPPYVATPCAFSRSSPTCSRTPSSTAGTIRPSMSTWRRPTMPPSCGPPITAKGSPPRSRNGSSTGCTGSTRAGRRRSPARASDWPSPSIWCCCTTAPSISRASVGRERPSPSVCPVGEWQWSGLVD